MIAAAVLLAAAAQAAPQRPAPPRGVASSTAPWKEPSDRGGGVLAPIGALKSQIRSDQDAVRHARAVLKRAQKGKDEAATSRARQLWLQARRRLKADRAVLRQAIEAHDGQLPKKGTASP